MSVSQTLDELDRAAAAAGFAMASEVDDASTALTTPFEGDAVARGSRTVPIIDQPSVAVTAARRVDEGARSLVAGAHNVRDTVYNYLGLGATA